MKTTAVTIAQKEFADAIRSRLVWLLVVVFAVITIPQILSFRTMDPTTELATRNIATLLKPFLPLVGLLVGYKAIVGERESGSLRILLGLPSTRGDVVLGKVVGRAAVFLVAAVAGMIATGVGIRIIHGGIDLVTFVGAVMFMVLYGLSWVGIGVGLSAMVTTRFKAMAGAVGLYALFVLFWNSLVLPIAAFLFTGSASTDSFELIEIATEPQWYIYFQRLNPVLAYDGSRSIVGQLIESPLSLSGLDLFGIGMLIAWGIVPVVVGYWRFSRVDMA